MKVGIAIAPYIRILLPIHCLTRSIVEILMFTEGSNRSSHMD
ncbi:MAG: hypothetical protein PUP91_24710 [Rhizonema sp. PD37]|nr:hypothetical protein [Rhizonema sp. PD37]